MNRFVEDAKSWTPEQRKAEVSRWVDAIRRDGTYDRKVIRETLSKITYHGKPVVVKVATYPISARGKILEVATEAEMEEAAPWRSVWDFYDLVYFFATNRGNLASTSACYEFCSFDIFPAIEAGLGFIVNLGELVVGITMPKISTNAANQLHCADGPAVVWPDDPVDSSDYWWNGVRIPNGLWIDKPDSVDLKEEWEKNPSMELRRCLAEIVGWERLLPALGAKKIHEDHRGELYEADLDDDDGRPAKFARYVCATGRVYFQRVNPSAASCLEALADAASVGMGEYVFGEET